MLLPYAQIANADNISPYVAESMGQCVSPLSTAFFSRTNINDIQIALRERIRCSTGHMIDRQSDEHLVIIMRAIYAMHAQNPAHAAAVPPEVARLNDLVLRDIVPMVASNLGAYLGYLRDASQMPTPIARGVNTSRRGQDVFSLFPSM